MDSLEKQIKKEGHLNDMPCAEEIEKEGINLGKFNRTLFERVEELTLYMIELKKENEVLKKRIGYMEKQK